MIPNSCLSNWLKYLHQDCTKTAEKLDVLLSEDSSEDRELLIEVSVLFPCVFLPPDTVDRFSVQNMHFSCQENVLS